MEKGMKRPGFHRDLSRIANPCVEPTVEELSIATILVPLEWRFEDEARFFEHSARGGVEIENGRGDAEEAAVAKAMIGDCLDHGGHDAAAPIGFGDPVADLGAVFFSAAFG